MASSKVTMKHVAKMADVSVQTVSAVINNKPGITKETTERVNHAIAQLGYRPFSVARSLRTGETRTIAMVVSDIANPSFSTMASTAEDYVHEMGYTLFLYNTHDDIEREASYIRMASQRWVDGMLVVPARDHAESLASLQKAGIPFVVIDRTPDRYEGPLVMMDHCQAGTLAANYLLKLGHIRLGHISGPMRLRLARDRQEGFVAAIHKYGLDGALLGESAGWSCGDGYSAMQKMILRAGSRQKLPTALFCASDRLAIGAILALSEAGYRVPEDVSIIGLDDIEVSAYQVPPLTTICQPFAEIGKRGIKMLLDLMNHHPIEQNQILIQPELIIRQSTAAPHS